MIESNKYTEKLKRKRMNMRTKIREHINKGKNVDKLKEEYQKILDELVSLGVNVSTKSSTDYLHGPVKIYNIIKTESVGESQEKIEEYKLNISWTNKIDISIIDTLKIYLDKYCTFVSEDYNDMITRKEYTITYLYKGLETSFNQFKSYMITTLDILNTDNKYDIGIFGNKIVV